MRAICEDNVYINLTRLLPENFVNKTKPSGKTYTSLAATVYSGPRSEHAAIGSVGTEAVTVIRREEMSYFIEYKVTSSGKLKRGFIHIDHIQRPTTGQLPEIFTGNYHIKNKKMWYDENSEYQEWFFESLETAYSTETQSPLLMNMVDNCWCCSTKRILSGESNRIDLYC